MGGEKDRVAEFSISDVAFTGFRVVRENFRAFLIWAAFSLAWSIVLALVGFVVMKPALDAWASIPKGGALELPQAEAFLRALVPGLPIMLLLQVIVGSVVRTAMNRIVLAPEAPSFAFFALGPDEVRQVGLSCSRSA